MDIKRSRQLLSLTIIFFWASEYCHAPYFTPYLQTMGFAAEIIGILTGTYGFTQMLVRIPLGIVTDTAGCYKKTILMGTMFTTASSFWLMFATDFVSILICRVLAGVAASSWLAFTILYAAYYQADESVRAVTKANGFNSAGKLLAFILGLTTASLWGYKVPLLCSFLTGVTAIVCASLLKPSNSGGRASSFPTWCVHSPTRRCCPLPSSPFCCSCFCRARCFLSLPLWRRSWALLLLRSA